MKQRQIQAHELHRALQLCKLVSCEDVQITSSQVIACDGKTRIAVDIRTRGEAVDTWQVSKTWLASIVTNDNTTLLLTLHDDMTITANIGDETIKGMAKDIKDYPVIKNYYKKGEEATYRLKDIQTALKTTMWATKMDDIRPICGYVYLNPTEQGTDIVGTDGHRLVRTEIQTKGATALLSPQAQKIVTLLDGYSLTITNYIEVTKDKDGNEVESAAPLQHIQTEDVDITLDTLVGKYPSYSVITDGARTEIEMRVDKQALLTALQKLNVFGVVANMKIERSVMTLKTFDTDFGISRTIEIPCRGERDIEVGFNLPNLIKVISILVGSTIAVRYTTIERAFMWQGADLTTEVILMPVLPKEEEK